VSEQSKNSATSQPRVRLFADSSCDEVLYRVQITRDKFDYDAFLKAVDQRPKQYEWGDVICPSRNADYHVHIAWMEHKAHLRVQVGYYSGLPEPTLIPKNVIYAEDAMQFVGKFFKNESAQMHIHADFDFGEGRRSKFPLPLRTIIGSCKTEIDGIALKPIDAPSGVSRMWISQRKEELTVQLFVDKRIVFDKFSVAEGIRDLASMIDGLTEVKL
jgi:hypothetical protein